MIKKYNLHPTVRSGLGQIPRETLHVCKANAKNVEYLYDNVPRGHLFHTILKAMAVSESYFDIIVWPGTWVEDATIDFGTKESMRMYAADFGPGHAKKNTHIRQYNGSNVPVVTVNGAHNIEIAGFRLSPYDLDSETKNDSIAVAQTIWTHGVYIHDNYFSNYKNNGQCILLGAAGGAGTEATDAVVENNDFNRGGGSVALQAQLQMHDCPRAHILHNKFDDIGVHGLSIHYTELQTTHYRSAWICDNYFVNSDGNAGNVGIDVGATEPGRLVIIGNHFVNYASEVACISDIDADLWGLNYRNIVAISSTA